MSARNAEWCANRPKKPCECGCGQLIFAVDRWNRPRHYAQGHHSNRPRRKHLKVLMSLAEARAIAGTLSYTTKMPGFSYGLDAFSCKKGSELAAMPGSTCRNCYARRNFYGLPHVRKSQQKRQGSLTHPRWVDAMVELILHHCAEEPWFRWHDSGDLVDVGHLWRIMEVVKRTPHISHWLPTREFQIVREFIHSGGLIPANLTIRLSAHFVDGASFPGRRGLEHLPTSTVHTEPGKPVQVSERRRDSVECRAYLRAEIGGGSCGPCRACWSRDVPNVSYPSH